MIFLGRYFSITNLSHFEIKEAEAYFFPFISVSDESSRVLKK